MMTPPPMDAGPAPAPKPYPGFWQAVGLFVLWIFVSIVVSVPAVIADLFLGNKKNELATHPAVLSVAFVAGSLVVLFIARQRTGRGLRQLLSWVPLPPAIVLPIAGMTASLLMLGMLSFLWIERAFPGSVPTPDYGFAKSPVLALFLIVIAAPFSEEILMRGIFLRGFEGRYGTRRAILLSATFFALAHVSPVRMPEMFLFGAMLGWMYVRTRSLWVSIGAHLLNNLIAGVWIMITAASKNGADLPKFTAPPFHFVELFLTALGLSIFYLSARSFQRLVPPPSPPSEPDQLFAIADSDPALSSGLPPALPPAPVQTDPLP